jgi:hypothetical protein
MQGLGGDINDSDRWITLTGILKEQCGTVWNGRI